MAEAIESVDLARELDAILAGVGLAARDTGGTIVFEGRDPVVDSHMPLGAITALGRMAPAVAAAAIWRLRGGRGQDLRCDLRQAVQHLRPPATLNGIDVNAYNLKFGQFNGYTQEFVPTRDGRHISMAGVYPPNRDALADVIGLPSHRAEDIRAAVARRDGFELEDAAARRGAALVVIRSEAEWRASEPGRLLAARPLVEIERIGESPAEPLGPGKRPLAGIRAVGMGRVLAGPVIGMTLAEHGADVLNLWAPEDVEMSQAYLKGNLGMRSALVRDRTPEGLALIRDLVAGGDIVFENRRDGAAVRRGLDFDSCAATRPGIIHVSLRCFGHYGAWKDRVGFDTQALSAAGCAAAEGGLATPRYPPTLIVNDWVAAWFGALGAMAALVRRAREGGSWRVRVSLARTTMWWLGLPRATGTPAGMTKPYFFEADTPLGRYRGVDSQVRYSETQPYFETPLVPWGSSPPAWLPR